MIPSLVRPATPPTLEQEDIFSAALGLIFTDETRNQHGDPGSLVTYRSSAFGPIKLRLADPGSEDNRRLFAHYLWNAAVLLAELVGGRVAWLRDVRGGEEANAVTAAASSATAGTANGSNVEGSSGSVEEERLEKGLKNDPVDDRLQNERTAGDTGNGNDNDINSGNRKPAPTNKPNPWTLVHHSVLELGAGSGLVGIAAALAGAATVTITDYPAPEILATIRANVAANLLPPQPNAGLTTPSPPQIPPPPPPPPPPASRVSVRGHEWGVLQDDEGFAQAHRHAFARVVAADTLWIPGAHEALLESVAHFLAKGDGGGNSSGNDGHDEGRGSGDGGRAWIVAGFHTGRAKVAAFFEAVARSSLEVESIREMDTDGRERAWAPVRDGGREDITERKRWCVLAVLRWKSLDVKE